MAVGPSKGAMKKMFDPANMKKKMKNAVGYAKPGGNNTSRSEKPRLFGRKVD